MSEKVEQLLHQVKIIDDAYRIVKKNTGEDFNLFQILGMETAEVKTHSKFLAELLNPKGSHLQGDVFLKLFIEYLNKITGEGENVLLLNENRINLNPEKANVRIENYIGKKNEYEGGRIDITINDSSNIICIENKIYAVEQDRQMERYGNYAFSFTTNHLFFLTLWGNKTTTNGNFTVYPISYKKHIVEWLELCKKETVNLPILRESIGQYINLIKKLTNQTTNVKMAKDIVEIIADNSRNFESSKLIKENFDRAMQLLIDEQKNILIELFIKKGFDKADLSIEKSLVNDGFFLKLRDFEFEKGNYELRITFELKNNYYFFCMVKQNEKRNPKHNNDEIFLDIINTLHSKFENYNLISNAWTIGKSEDFKIGIDPNNYYYPGIDNTKIYGELIDQIMKIKKDVDSIFNS